jgi:hypothetical protein
MNEMIKKTDTEYYVMFDDDDTLPSDHQEGKGCAIWSLVLIVCIIAGAIFLLV